MTFKHSKLLLVLALTVCCGFNYINCSNVTCVENTECNNGVCNDGFCVCSKGYISYANVCEYQQRKSNVAFWLSFSLGAWGADWFYLARGNGGYIGAGVGKLCTGLLGFWAPIIFCICSLTMLKSKYASLKNNRRNASSGFLGCCGFASIVLSGVAFALAQAAWWMADWIRILVGSFKDGNGQDLAPW
jgi:hypothetical protein